MSCDSVESPSISDGASPASNKVLHVADVHAPHTALSKSLGGFKKRHRGSTESVESVPPTKVSTSARDCGVSTDMSVGEVQEAPIEPAATHSVQDHVASLGDSVRNHPRDYAASGSGVQSGSSIPAMGRDSASLNRKKLELPRPGSSRVPVSSRRINVPSQVGKGQSLPRARPKHPPS